MEWHIGRTFFSLMVTSADLQLFFGEDVIRRLLDGTRPGWESDLRMSRERHLCLVESGQDTARRALMKSLPRDSSRGVPGKDRRQRRPFF
jgi:hypothetical protein